MPDDPQRTVPDRDRTDHSLRHERHESDRAIKASLEAVEQDADRIVDLARDTADAVLEAARTQADQNLSKATPAAARATIDEARVIEDAILDDERATADEVLRLEREETARALARLLPLERHKTDRHLLTERALADDAVANRDDFLGIVSHDLRNLLGGIVVSTSLLEKRASDTEEGKRVRLAAERIQRYAARMNRLIGDLLDVAAIDAGKLAMSCVAQDAAALVHEALDTFGAEPSARGVTLEVEVGEGPWVAAFDHDRMLQVFGNLVSNALKVTPDGGRIVLGCELGESLVRFWVRDSGPGIPADMHEVIFERFRRVRQDDRTGVGLGLYIARCIVEAHGGRIWAESTPGNGATFYCTVPIGGCAT